MSDVVLTTDSKIEADGTLMALAVSYKDSNPSVVPIFEKGKFYGLISIDDITSWLMQRFHDSESVDSAPVIRTLMHEQDVPLQLTDLFEETKSGYMNLRNVVWQYLMRIIMSVMLRDAAF